MYVHANPVVLVMYFNSYMMVDDEVYRQESMPVYSNTSKYGAL